MGKLNRFFIITRKSARLFYFLALLWLFVFPSNGYAAPETMVIYKAQYNQLVQTNTKLIVRLTMLSQQVKMLREPSAQLVNELSQAETELVEVQKSLAIAQQNLLLSSRELVSAKASLEKANQSLMQLESKINKIKAVERRLRWQRNLWSAIASGFAIIAGGALIANL